MNMRLEITFAELQERLPRRRGKKINVRTIMRWAIQGCRGVKLVAWKRGGIWYTTEEEVERFRIAGSRHVGANIERTPAEVASAAMEAREKLRRDGFYGGRTKQKDTPRQVPHLR